MKPREPRRKVFVPARLRCDASWSDGRVLDVSSRGFLVEAYPVPLRGAYIEVARGSQSYVARVIWTGQQRFGVRTQDRMAIDAFICPPAARMVEDDAAGEAVAEERRINGRRQAEFRERFDESRALARVMEFGSLVAGVAFGAMVILGLLQQALSHPFAQISAALAAH